jgi:hypothetical protein
MQEGTFLSFTQVPIFGINRHWAYYVTERWGGLRNIPSFFIEILLLRVIFGK